MGLTRHPLSTAAALRDLAKLPPDEALIGRLERSFELVAADGDAFARRFYDRLFAGHPHLRALFPTDLSEQRRKLLATLRMVVVNLRSPEVVQLALHALGRQHATYGAHSAEYEAVVAAAVGAMGETAGKVWTIELQADWTSALRLVGEIMREGAQQVAPPAPAAPDSQRIATWLPPDRTV